MSVLSYLAAKVDVSPLPNVEPSGENLRLIIQIALGIIGAVALIFIILAALKMTTSQGDPQSTAQARKSIIYSLVGLVIIIMAQLIVTFVLGRV